MAAVFVMFVNSKAIICIVEKDACTAQVVVFFFVEFLDLYI